MNYDENKIRWHVGDIVIHDADEKTELYLMHVVGILSNGDIKTKYLNRQGNQKYYINRFEVLHDPRRFDIIFQQKYDCDVMSETLKRNWV